MKSPTRHTPTEVLLGRLSNIGDILIEVKKLYHAYTERQYRKRRKFFGLDPNGPEPYEVGLERRKHEPQGIKDDLERLRESMDRVTLMGRRE